MKFVWDRDWGLLLMRHTSGGWVVLFKLRFWTDQKRKGR